ESPARVVDQSLEVRAVLAEPPLQRTTADRQSPRHVAERRLAMSDRLADGAPHRLNKIVPGWELRERIVEIALHDRIEPRVGRGDRPLAELALDDQRVVLAPERHRRAEHAVQLRDVD